jgi:hypothetical protein
MLYFMFVQLNQVQPFRFIRSLAVCKHQTFIYVFFNDAVCSSLCTVEGYDGNELDRIRKEAVVA